MIIETKRLILRPWEESDAEKLYEYAKDPKVGPSAGWPVHTSVENSRQILKDVLMSDETYAIVVKEIMEPIGSLGLMIGEKSGLNIPDNEAEIGYWIGVPFWGNGYVPEGVKKIMDYGFETLGLQKMWCGYFDGNEKSRRAQEKCGFKYVRTEYNKPWPLINAVKDQHVTVFTRQEWENSKKSDIQI